MTQAFIYSSKVWLTTIAIAYVTSLSVTYYRLAQPDHSRELSPMLDTIVFVVGNMFFIPAWGAFIFCIKPITEWYTKLWKQKAALNGMACILVIFTFSPVFISHASDETYYPLAGFYLVVISISAWLYRPIPLSEVNAEEIPNTEL